MTDILDAFREGMNERDKENEFEFTHHGEAMIVVMNLRTDARGRITAGDGLVYNAASFRVLGTDAQGYVTVEARSANGPAKRYVLAPGQAIKSDVSLSWRG